MGKLENIEMVDYQTLENPRDYFEGCFDLHKTKRGVTIEETKNIFKNNLSYLAAMMVKDGGTDRG